MSHAHMRRKWGAGCGRCSTKKKKNNNKRTKNQNKKNGGGGGGGGKTHFRAPPPPKVSSWKKKSAIKPGYSIIQLCRSNGSLFHPKSLNMDSSLGFSSKKITQMTLLNGKGFRGLSGTPPSKSNMSTPPPPPSKGVKIVCIF